MESNNSPYLFRQECYLTKRLLYFGHSVILSHKGHENISFLKNFILSMFLNLFQMKVYN